MTLLLVAAAAGVVAGAALQAATGFGLALVAAPLLFAALGPEEAIGTLIVLGAEVALLTLGTERRRPEPLARDAAALLAWSAPGAVAGVAVLRALDDVALQVAVTLGVAGTLAARRLAARRERPAAGERPAWSAPLAGFTAGALSTSTSTNGPPLLLHLLGRGATPDQFRDTLTVCFLGLSAIGALALWLTGTSGAAPDPELIAVLVPLAAAGHLAGRRGFRRLAEGGGYEPVVTGVLLVSVAVGLVAQLA